MSTYNVVAYGGLFTLSPETLLGWSAATVTSISATQLTLEVRNGGIVVFPGDHNLVLTGSFNILFGNLLGGTVTGVEGQMVGGTTLSTLSGLSINLAGLINAGGASLDSPDIATVFGGADAFNGGTGNDVLRGYDGGDDLVGGNGDDVLLFQAGDSAASDVISGGAGIDTVRVTASMDFTSASFLADIERIDFGQGSGAVTATFKSNLIAALPNLTIDGSVGTDLLTIAGNNQPNINLQNLVFTNWTDGIDLVTANGTLNPESVVGTAGKDSINGGAGNDTIRGAGGADILNGDAGFDFFTYFQADGVGADTIDGGADPDEIRISEAGSFNFTGATIANVEKLNFEQTTGTATVSLTAAQLMAFDQVLQSANADAIVVSGSSIDLSSVTFNWGTGGDTITLNGTGAADVLTGSAMPDIINGGVGADTIRGGLGGDQLNSAAGNDVFVFGAANELLSDTIDGGADTDTLRIDFAGANIFGTVSNVEAIDFNQASGSASALFLPTMIGDGTVLTLVDGSASTDLLTVQDQLAATFTSIDISNLVFTNWTAGVDVISLLGTGGGDTLVGSSRDDVFEAGDSADLLVGGNGSDTMNGGTGDDVYLFSGGSEIGTGESIGDQGGFDTVRLSSASIYDFRTTSFGIGLEMLDFDQASGSTTARLTNVIVGAPGAVTVNGSAGADTLQVEGLSVNVGGATFVNWTQGVDSVILDASAAGASTVSGSLSEDLIRGAGFGDRLAGNDGNDTITGGIGADTMNGGEGSDLFSFNTGEGAAGEFIDGGNGVDTLRIEAGQSVDLALALGIDNVEILDFAAAGTALVASASFGAAGKINTVDGDAASIQSLTIASVPGTVGARTIDISGLTFSNWTSGVDSLSLNGSLAPFEVTMVGSNNAETFIGSGFADSITGAGGNDTIDGGAGNDQMFGGDGDDIYFMDSIGDLALEQNTTGFDIVISTVDTTLSDNIEQLVLRGGATIGVGNNSANFLYGGDSGLSLNLDGAGGDDIFYSGLAGHNTLTGGAGVDTLQLFGGNNQANGGAGSDIYFTFTDTDIISEAGGDGIDTVFANWNYTMGAGIEQLLLFGSANAAQGSADDNVMFGNSTSGAVNLSGLDGADVLIGGSFNDTLVGGAGNDQMFGLGGNNVLEGGIDNDIYYLATLNNTITELGGEGFDTIISDLAFTMASNTEQGIIFGTANSITGNDGDNFIYNVGTANSTLSGGLGNDYLRGSDHNDVHDGGFGNDQLDLRGGGDDRLFYSAGNMGNDIAFGFDADAAGGQDLIDLTGRGYTGASIGAAITIGSTSGDALITFNTGSLAGTTLRLFGVSSGAVEATDFLF